MDKYCGRCISLEAINDHEIEHFVSLLDQQNMMLAEGRITEAKSLNGPILSARQVVVAARTRLLRHRARHSQNLCTSPPHVPGISVGVAPRGAFGTATIDRSVPLQPQLARAVP